MAGNLIEVNVVVKNWHIVEDGLMGNQTVVWLTNRNSLFTQ